MESKLTTHSYTKFQSILSYPAVVVPSLSEDDIKITLLEAILSYLEDSLPLEVLVSLSATIQQYMGLRGENCSELYNALNKLSTLSEQLNKKDTLVEASVNEVLLQTLDSFTTNKSH